MNFIEDTEVHEPRTHHVSHVLWVLSQTRAFSVRRAASELIFGGRKARQDDSVGFFGVGGSSQI